MYDFFLNCNKLLLFWCLKMTLSIYDFLFIKKEAITFKDALNWSKVTVKRFIMLQKISVFCFLFNIDSNKKCFSDTLLKAFV